METKPKRLMYLLTLIASLAILGFLCSSAIAQTRGSTDKLFSSSRIVKARRAKVENDLTSASVGKKSDKWISRSKGDGWITWCGEFSGSGIGTNDVADFYVAQRFEPTDLTDYSGYYLTKVKFIPVEEACTYSILIWQGGDNSYNPGTQIANIEITTADLTIGTWNEVNLPQTITIDATKELWIGVRCNTTTGYPAGYDVGPEVAGKGNLVYMNGSWSELTDLGSSLNYNWCIQGYVQATAPTMNIPSTPTGFTVFPNPYSQLSATLSWKNPTVTAGGDPLTSITSVNILRDGTLIHSITSTTPGEEITWVDSDVPTAGTYSYSVYAVNENGSGNSASRTATIGGIYNMPITGVSEITVYNATIYDDGGPSANYSLNCNSAIIVHPLTEGDLVVLDGSFSLESGYDFLYIYDGEGTSGELLGVYSGSGTIKNISKSGSITIYFTSDDVVTKPGFEISVNNVQKTNVSGKVTSVTTGNPIEGVSVSLTGVDTYKTNTSSDGTYSLPVVTGTYDINVSLTGYNVYSESNFSVSKDGVTGKDFVLTNPVMSVTPTSVKDSAYYMSSAASKITISNTGNGALNWSNSVILNKSVKNTKGATSSALIATTSGWIGCSYYLFNLDDPSTLTPLNISLSNYQTTSAEYMNGMFYVASISGAYDAVGGNLLSINPETAEINSITTNLNIGCIAYNPVDNQMYGVDLTDTQALYTVDVTTGQESHIVDLQTTDWLIGGFAITNDGRFFIIDADKGGISEINPETGELTLVIKSGFNIYSNQDLSVDRETNTLYWAAYNGSAGLAQLYRVDLTKFSLELIGSFPENVYAFAIKTAMSWLMLDPAKGTIAPGQSMDASLIMDGWWAKEGSFSATVNILSDPNVGTIPVDVNFKILPTMCDGPTNLQATVTDWSKLTLLWNAPADAEGVTYNLYVDSLSHTPLVTGITDTFYVDNNKSEGVYTYVVRAVWPSGCVSYATNKVEAEISYCDPSSKCNVTIKMFDSGYLGIGGWNGASISVISNGHVLGTATIDNGTSAQATFSVCPGTVEFIWNSGTNDSECSFEIFDGYNIPIYASSGTPNSGTITTYENNCEPPKMITVSGTVSEKTGGAPISDASVIFTGVYGDTIVTNTNGEYSIDLVQGFNYAISVNASGYNAYSDAYTAPNAETGTINFALTKPILSISPSKIDLSTNYTIDKESTITISNTGDGSLDWSSAITYPSKADNSLAFIVKEGIIYKFNLNNPNGLKQFCTAPSADIIRSDFFNGKYYALASTASSIGGGVLYSIDPETAIVEQVASNLYSGAIAYNPVDGKLYGMSLGYSPIIYTIDLETGIETKQFPILCSVYTYVFSMTITNDGRILVPDTENDGILEINPATGESKVLISVGFEVNGAQDMAMDRETNTPYWFSFNYYPSWSAELYKIDLSNNSINLIGSWDPGIKASGFAIATKVGWLKREPAFGSLAAGESQTINVTLDGSWANGGTYNADLNFTGLPLVEEKTTNVTFTINAADTIEVNGKVTNGLNDETIEGAALSFNGYGGSKTVTDNSGMYTLNLLSGLNYEVKVEKYGFESYNQESFTTPSTNTSENFELTPKSWGIVPINVTTVGSNSSVNVSWEMPNNENWITWGGEFSGNCLGTGGEMTLYMAQRFDTSDLKNYHQYLLTNVQFVPGEDTSICKYSIEIWTGGSAYHPGTLVLEQDVPDEMIIAKEWNEVKLKSPIEIDASKELWIGLKCNAKGGYPIAYDNGPSVSGKGGLINFDGYWNDLKNLGIASDYNICIKGFAANQEDGKTFNLYRNNSKIATNISEYSYSDSDLSGGTYCYAVTSNCFNGSESEKSEESCETITSVPTTFDGQIKVYPNPVHNKLQINIVGDELVHLTVINSQGVSVLENSFYNNITLDVTTIPSGLYLIRLSCGNKQETYKVIVK